MIVRVLLLVALLALQACGAVNDMSEMFAKQEKAQKLVKEKHGLSTQVGFNFHNGVFTQVTVVFQSSEVKDKKVSELEAIATEAVKASFESTPKALNVQVTSVEPPQT